MKKLFVIYLVIINFAFTLSFAQKSKILSPSYPVNKLTDLLLKKSLWKPFPTSRDRLKWNMLPSKLRESYIEAAEKHLNSKWETPTATLFLDFFRTGNRSRYEAISFSRRIKLTELVLAECIEGKGRFLNEIINGIWLICEETYWGLPAHINAQKKQNSLPDITEPTVDLFAAETGMLLAFTEYLLHDDLKNIDSLISERICHEVDRKIISVNEARNDFWWMGFTGKNLNNWTPWICSNWLATVLLIEKDSLRRAKNVYKILECLDNYLNNQTADGGCDEGPGYWNRAAASLFECLELLHSSSDGRISFINLPVIQEMGKYILKTHIDSNYFVNFADSPHIINLNPSLIFRYGKHINNETMMKFGAFIYQSQNLEKTMYLKEKFGCINRLLPAIFNLSELSDYTAAKPMFNDFFLPDIQIAGARSLLNSSSGFYFAAQGGHNAESHNHNDVGNFILYFNGKPLIIDVGPEQYTSKTFSSKRYEIWTMQSGYHNLPTINGVMQKEGKQYTAESVSFKYDKSKAIFDLDIAKAYPKEAAVKKWNRKIILTRGKGIDLYEDYILDTAREFLTLNFLVCTKPIIEKEGIISMNEGENGIKHKILMQFNGAIFTPEIEIIKLDDANLIEEWGKCIFRLKLKSKKLLIKDSILIKIYTQE